MALTTAATGGNEPLELSPMKRQRTGDDGASSSVSSGYISLTSMETSWRSQLQVETSKPYFKSLLAFLNTGSP